MKHFHDQELDLISHTSKKTLFAIFAISIALAVFATNALAKGAKDFADCTTIKIQTIKNGQIESDSIDELTLTMQREEATRRALDSLHLHKASLQKSNGTCTVEIEDKSN